MRYLAKTLEGLEEVLAQELKDLGATNVMKLTRAVSFYGDKELMYKANYMLRTALRILEIRTEFTAHDAEDLYRKVYKLPWDQLIKPTDTIAIDAVTTGEVFTHSKFTALKTKDAVVDKIRKTTGDRPNINIYTPTYRMNVHIRDKTVTLSMDTSGESLHMRGYRITAVDAPLNEVLAAGLIALSGWDKQSTLLDPMCGSGTILIEADRIARNVPPQYADREFGFKRWKTFDNELWEKIVKDCDSNIKSSGPSILGYDKNLRALKVSEQNIDEADAWDHIKVEKKDFFKSSAHEPLTIITNPPYDMRLKEDDIVKFYKRFGDQLKQEYTGCTAWIISGAIFAIKLLGLKPSRRISLLNGGIEAKYCKFEMYAGTKN